MSLPQIASATPAPGPHSAARTIPEQPTLHVDEHYQGKAIFRFTDDYGAYHRVAFDGRHGRLLVAAIYAFQQDEGDLDELRGCRLAEEYAQLLPSLVGDSAPLTKRAITGYVYSIRKRTREEFELESYGIQVAHRLIATVRQHGFRAGLLLRRTKIVVRHTSERVSQKIS